MFHANRVSSTKGLTEREAPRWLIIAVAILGVTTLTFFGYRALTGREGEPGPRMKVYPGMYDLRAEVAKMRAAHPMGNATDGH